MVENTMVRRDLISAKSSLRKLMTQPKREYVTADKKRRLMLRANGVCENKSCNYDRNLEVHHINLRNDDNKLRNLRLLCRNCHADKHAKKRLKVKGFDPITGKKVIRVVKKKPIKRPKKKLKGPFDMW